MDHGEKIRAAAALTPGELAARRRDMIDLKAKGWTLAKIGEKYGISREAVRLQIAKGDTVRRWGAPSAGPRREIEERLAKWRGRKQTAATQKRVAELEAQLASIQRK
jgi:hypothetical protein